MEGSNAKVIRWYERIHADIPNIWHGHSMSPLTMPL